MEEWQKDWIRSNLNKLVKATRFRTISIHLVEAELIALDDVTNLETKANYVDYGHLAVPRMMYELLMEEPNSYDKLIEILDKECQNGASGILKEGKKLEEARRIAEAKEQEQAQEVAARQTHDEVDRTPPTQVQPEQQTLLEKAKKDVKGFIEKRISLKVRVKNSLRVGSGLTSGYKLTRAGKRYVMFINIIEFQDKAANRHVGGEVDTRNMKDVWEGLGFTVFLGYPNDPLKRKFTKEEVIRAAEKFRNKCEEDQVELCVFIIGSHGDQDNIETSDGSDVHVMRDIAYHFGKSSKQLNEIPKVFIVQSCQDFLERDTLGKKGKSRDLGDTPYPDSEPSQTSRPSRDAISTESLSHAEEQIITNSPSGSPPSKRRKEADEKRPPKIDNAIMLKAQLPGDPAYRDSLRGSWMLFVLTYVLMNFAGEAHLEDLFKMVGKLVPMIDDVFYPDEDGQLAPYMHMGLDTLYLVPE